MRVGFGYLFRVHHISYYLIAESHSHVIVKYPFPSHTYQLLPVHALVEVLKLQLALLLGPGVADAVGALDPLLLEGVAAGRPLVGLLSALQQDPAVHVDAQTRLHVHERHDDDDAAAAGKQRGQIKILRKGHVSGGVMFSWL